MSMILEGYMRGYMDKSAAEGVLESLKNLGGSIGEGAANVARAGGRALFEATDAAPAQRLLPILLAIAGGYAGSHMTENPLVGMGAGATTGALTGSLASRPIDNALVPAVYGDKKNLFGQSVTRNWDKRSGAEKDVLRSLLTMWGSGK